MRHTIKTLSLLWNYLNIYYLKPFDAVNDTLTANLLLSFKWPDNYTEIGSGDGAYSYVMHGGSFPISYDRYMDIDLNKTDIFDAHNMNFNFKLKSINKPRIDNAIDSKINHIKKIKSIGYAENILRANFENLPFLDNTIGNIFFYTPHGFTNYENCIKEAVRVLKPNGRIFILAYNSKFEKSFLSYRLKNYFDGFMKTVFTKIDNGRYKEIIQMAKTQYQWEEFFDSIDLKLIKVNKGLSFFAWKIYDIQTRPILSLLVNFFNFFPGMIRKLLKLIWMSVWYPILVFFYLFFSKSFRSESSNCYFAFELLKK